MTNKQKNEIARSFILLSQIGITMVVTIFFCFWIGTLLDNKFTDGNFFAIIGLFVGCAAGLRNMMVMVSGFWKD